MNNSVCTHEAAHVTGAIAAAGWVPLEVRVDHPEDGVAGVMLSNFTEHGLDYGCLIVTLAGPASEGELIAWPPSRDSHKDERDAAILVEHLGLTESDYATALAVTERLLRAPEVKAATALVARALARVSVITERQLRELLGPYIDAIRQAYQHIVSTAGIPVPARQEAVPC